MRKKITKKARNYEEDLLESLKQPKEAIAYLNAHLEDEEKDAEELFLMALRDVARAHGFGEIASRADLGRESLYKALSHEGNPRLTTLRSVLKALGLKLSVEPERKKAA